MNKPGKKNPITVSKRNVDILLTLSRGPITLNELRERCFRKDPAVDYISCKREQDRHVAQARDEDPYVSRQFTDRKMKQTENRGLAGSAEYFEITTQGMPTKQKIYYLTEKGFHHVNRTFGAHKYDIRYGKPLDIHTDHEVNLSRILRKIYDDAEKGHYQVRFAHADRALRSIFAELTNGASQKGFHFLDLRVGVLRRDGTKIDLPLELANIKDDPDFWQTKIREIDEPFFILTKNDGFVRIICKWILETKLGHAMYVAELKNFLQGGLTGTVWKKVSAGKIEEISL